MNTISALDKMQAKRLGITVEEYKEKEQTAKAIWYKLISQGKIYNPFHHVPTNKRLVTVGTVGIISLFFLTLLTYNALMNIGAETKGMWVVFIISTVIYIIGEFAMYHHDMKEFEKYVNRIATWEDTPCKENQFMMDCINRALEFNGKECYGNTPIPFCSLHTKVADDGTKTHSLEFSGLSDWNYNKSIPLQRMDYNYVVNTMRLELVTFMEEWAKNLIETELLVESEDI